MTIYRVQGGKPLHGSLTVQTAKNAVLPTMAASLLTDDPIRLNEVSNILDVEAMCELLEQLGSTVILDENNDLTCITGTRIISEPAISASRQLRGSILTLGPLLARTGRAAVNLPGGCDIGSRSVSVHIEGLKCLGARVVFENDRCYLRANRLYGSRVQLNYPSRTATENILMAAVLAEGKTVIENAAMEPEIADFAQLLVRMGARVHGAGTSTIRVEGVKRLHGTTHRCIPDRVAAITYLLAAAITGGAINLQNVVPGHFKIALRKLSEMGCRIEEAIDQVYLEAPNRLRAVDLQTLPYPGFSTDFQPLFTAALSLSEGTSVVAENIFENRFGHVGELCKLGANIYTSGQAALIRGVPQLTGTRVKAADLRGGAGIVLACLAAKGSSEIHDVHHIERGYASLVDDIQSLGGEMEKVDFITAGQLVH